MLGAARKRHTHAPDPDASAWLDPADAIPTDVRDACAELEAGLASGRGQGAVRAWAVVRGRADAASRPWADADEARAAGTGDGPWDTAQLCLERDGAVPPTLLGLWSQRVLSWSPSVSAAFPAAAELLRVRSCGGHVEAGPEVQCAQLLAGTDGGGARLGGAGESEECRRVLACPGTGASAGSSSGLSWLVGEDVASALSSGSDGKRVASSWGEVRSRVASAEAGEALSSDDGGVSGLVPAGPAAAAGCVGRLPRVSGAYASWLLGRCADGSEMAGGGE